MGDDTEDGYGVPLKTLQSCGCEFWIDSEHRAYQQDRPNNPKAKLRKFRLAHIVHDEGEIVVPKGYVMVVDSCRLVRLLPEDTLVFRCS